MSRPSSPASYASIMVHSGLGEDAADRVRLAAGLADRFEARLIGIAAENVVIAPYLEVPSFVEQRLIEEARRRIDEDLAKAEAVFRKAAGPGREIEWRSDTADPRGYLLTQARAADLFVIGHQPDEVAEDWHMGVPPGDLVMGLGRPVLLVPPRVATPSARRIVLGWRDCREARRAVLDSLPFLQRAEEVIVTGVGDEVSAASLQDVVAHLGRHGAQATAHHVPAGRQPVAGELIEMASTRQADLIVCGGYGHSRMREWIFGGVTHEFVSRAPICCLMTH
jgi:nucleotide-binding universal stress UspA family protein